MSCFECGKESSEIYTESGDSRQWCFSCYASFTNRRFWAQKKTEEQQNYSKMGGICFHCNLHSQFGLFKDLSRDGNEERCKTWVCWPCHNERPDLSNFGMKILGGEQE